MSTEIPVYAFDPDGTLLENLVTEQQSIQSNDVFDYFYIIPAAAPFFAGSVKLRLYPGGRELVEGVDYNFGHQFLSATHTIGLPIYGSISFYDHSMAGIVDLEYQTLGGEWTLDENKILEILSNEVRNPRITTWETIVELPNFFPTINHSFDIDDFVGMKDVESQLEGIREAIESSAVGGEASHANDKNNPHEVTKAQTGLGLVDNFPTAALAEATAGVANNRFMTPLRTKQLIDATAGAALTLHLADLNNPHQTTKTHVGLGLVQNYGIATQADAEAGSSNTKYSTPLRVREAIDALVGNLLATHLANMTNPHQTTAAQVGLGSVNNFPIATQAQAETGTSNTLYMTPLLSRYLVAMLVGNDFQDHQSDYGNPHQVTKAQVGLGLVPNFQAATEAEARDATRNDRFMTPLNSRQTISELVGDISSAHSTDYGNPHQVTAVQVGAPTLAEFAAALALKLNAADPATDTTSIFGMTFTQTVDWIATLTSANSVLFDGMTIAEVSDLILTGTAADSDKLGGRSFSQLMTQVSSVIDASSNRSEIIANDNVLSSGVAVAPPVNWMFVGIFGINAELPYIDATLLLTGGRNYTDVNSIGPDCSALLNISGSIKTPQGETEPRMVISAAQVRYLNKSDYPIEMAWLPVDDGVDSYIELWVKNSYPRNRIIVNDLTKGSFFPAVMEDPVDIGGLVTVAPAGLTYFPVKEDGSQAHADLVALFNAYIARMDNPHQVTKSQVGLNLVSNYGDASPADALAGTAANKFMSPIRTKEAIDASASAILTEVTATLDDIIATFA